MKANQATTEIPVFKNLKDQALNSPTAESLDLDVIETEHSLLSQFRANLDQVEELNARLHFVLNEIRPLLRR